MKLSREKVDKLVADRGWSYAELAEEAEIAYQVIQRSFRGANTRPANVGKIAKALGVTMQDILVTDKDTVTLPDVAAVQDDMCIHYCRYSDLTRRNAISDSVLNNICAACPLNTLVKGGR